jgi:type I restriction enzyme S subunit
MREMKDSGVLWFGETPNSWERVKIGHLTRRKRVKANDLGVVTAFRDGQVTLRSNRRMDGFTEATEFHGYQLIRPGQVAVHRMDAFAGAIGVSDSEGMCSPVLTVLDCDRRIDPHYLALVLREAAKSGWIEALAKSIRERTSEFGWSELSSQYSLVPPIDVQKEIVSYLKQETSQIDLLISKKEQLIEKLLERRQALITYVVTKGLDPNAPLKDSGVDWLGEVPESWSVVPLWSLFRRVKRTGHSEETLLSVYRELGVIPKDSRDDNHNVASRDLSTYQLVDIGDLAVNKMKAWQGSISISNLRGIVSPAYFVLRPEQQGFDSRFIHHLLRSRPYVLYYLLASKGIRTGQWDLRPEIFRRTPILLPPLDEQAGIARYLDQEASQIQTLVDKTKRALDLLKERRQALITQVVTGKIDVRGFAGGNS